MPELNDDQLRKLFQAAGHSAPSMDLTSRIMAQVSVTSIARPVVAPPLIGRWGWAGIAAAILVVVIAGSFSAPGFNTSAVPYLDGLMRLVADLQLPAGNWPKWMIGASACAMFFLVIDQRLSRRSATTH